MRRLLVAVAVAAILVPAHVLPLCAATKRIPPTAFRTFGNYSPESVSIVTLPTVLSVIDNANPDSLVIFWAPVRLPVGATITRVRYWYMDSEARGTRLRLLSSRWGSSNYDTLAEIVTADTAGELTRVETAAITKPQVNAGEIILLSLELQRGGGCGGVRIDYEP